MPLLLQGAVCNEVKTIQIILNAKGYKSKSGKALTVDGELGENTAYAITNFQKANGMKNINFGSVAKRTWELLLK
jgi:peptidoglycan hydrolase-like protein with peptidoglycan-binding domain